MSDSGTSQFFDREGRLTTPPVGGSLDQAETSQCDEQETPGPVGFDPSDQLVRCPVGDENEHYERQNKHEIPEKINGPKHDFLLVNSKYDLLEVSAAIHELIEDLPKTATTFSVTDEAYEDVMPDWINKIPGFVRHKLAELHGAWIVPNRISTRTDAYVNPNSVHAGHHSDAAVWCDYCGNLIHQHEGHTNEPHGDDCPMYAQYATRARLEMNRERIVREVGPLGVNGEMLATRLNMSRQGDLVPKGVDRTALRDEYMERRRNTVAELLIRGYTSDEIAAAYGRTRRQIIEDSRKVLGMPPTEVADLYDLDLEKYARK